MAEQGFSGKLLKPYYWLEDKYYDLLDLVDRVIPAYKVVDPIEDRGIPTLALLLGLIGLVVLAGVVYAVVQHASAPPTYSLSVTLQDSQGFKVKRAEVTLSSPIMEGFSEKGFTDSRGRVVFEVRAGVYEASVYKEGYLESGYTFIVRKDTERTALVERE